MWGDLRKRRNVLDGALQEAKAGSEREKRQRVTEKKKRGKTGGRIEGGVL